jgi:hypothetical protein
VNIAMNLSPPLQHEIEQIATLQGISPDQFILQTLMEKINLIKNQDIDRSHLPNVYPAESRLQEKDGLLVFETESLNHIDFHHLSKFVSRSTVDAQSKAFHTAQS